MKKILVILFILCPAVAFAVGTCSEPSISSKTSGITEVIISCTADASDGSIPDTTISGLSGYVVGVYLDDGDTGITNGATDLSLKIASTDINLLGSSGTNMDTTNGYVTMVPKNTAGDNYTSPFAGDLTLSWAQNTVNSADPTVRIEIQTEP